MSALDADLFDERVHQPFALGWVAVKNDPLATLVIGGAVGLIMGAVIPVPLAQYQAHNMRRYGRGWQLVDLPKPERPLGPEGWAPAP